LCWLDFCKTIVKRIPMMKRILLVFLMITSFANAQYTVKGELQRYQNYPWMILYGLENGQQNYIAYDSINKGRFSIAIPNNQPPGMYRLVYDVKNQASVDFIFDNENVEFIFNPKQPEESIQFTESENNKVYQNYLRLSRGIQEELDSIQVKYFSNKEASLVKQYKSKREQLTALQKKFEMSADGRIAQHFIKASAKYYEKELSQSPNAYVNSIKTHYFDAIDFNDKVLLNSTFIHDRINTYIFYLNTSDDLAQLEKLQKEAMTTVMSKIANNHQLSKDVQEGLLYGFANLEDTNMVNFLMESYAKLPKEFQDTNFITDIKGQLRTSIGAKAPNFSLSEKDTSKDLYSLNGAQKYVVVFWSSTCGHCLQEMPVLYNYLKNNNDVKVVAIGLEDDESVIGWRNMILKYPNFSHVYGVDKWKNKTAKSYGVNATPSFFVLDAQKKVLSKPDNVKELKVFFGK